MTIRLLLLTALLGVAGAAAPLVHYPFDGNVTPSAGAEFGAAKVIGQISYVDGTHGQAIVLKDGARVIIPLPPVMQEGEWTISFWMRPLWHPQDQLAHPILDIPAAPDTYDKIDWSAKQLLVSKGWSEIISPNGWYGINGDIATRHVRPGKWTHIVVCRSRGGAFTASYIDGEGGRRLEKADKHYDLHGLTMSLGGRANGSHGHGDVVLDDLKIYARAIDPTELNEVAGVELPPTPDLDAPFATCDPQEMVAMPGTGWAPKLADPPRVVAVVESRRARDLLELSQRVQMDLTVIAGPGVSQETMISPERWEQMGREVEAEIAKGDVDCVVIAAFPWNRLLESSRQAILDYVTGGGGLLFVSPRVNNTKGTHYSAGHGLSLGWEVTDEGKAIEALFGRLPEVDADFLTASVPWRHLACFRANIERADPANLFRGGQVGKGRILLYDIFCGGHGRPESLTPTLHGFAQPNLFEYDYALAAAGRALLWTAGQATGPRIVDMRFDSINGFRELNIGARGVWVVTVYNPGDTRLGVHLATTVRGDGPDAPWTEARGIGAEPGYSDLHVPYTVDRVGTVFADIRMSVAGKPVDWASAAIVASGGNPSLVDCAMDQFAWRPGERPTVRAGIRYQDWGNKPTPTAQLAWRLYDVYGRLIETGGLPVKLARSDRAAAPVAWQLPPLPAYSRRFTLLVDLSLDQRPRDQKRLEFTGVAGLPTGFSWFSWGSGASVAEYQALAHLQQAYGLDCAMAYTGSYTPGPAMETEVARLTYLNLRPWLYATHLGGRELTPEGHRSPDLADQASLRTEEQRLAATVRLAKPYSPLFYSLGDEVLLGPWNAEPTGTEQDLFRSRMRDQYDKIEAFNEAFGTDYTSWADVRLPGQKEENPPPTVKIQRQWRHDLFTEYLGAHVQAALAVDPEARVGIEGIFGLQHAWSGFDYSKIIPASTYAGQYALGMDLDMVRSFASPGFLIGCWYNYDLLDEGYSVYGPWHTVLRGLGTFGWFTVFTPGRYTALCPDFRPAPHFAWTWSELADLDHGFGDLVLGLDRDNPGVRVLYEFANLDRSTTEYYRTCVMSQVLEDAGIMHDYLAGEQVRAGALAAVRVLILPGQHVMAPDVAAAIRAWTEAGGILLADTRPARANGLKDYETPLLDDLFDLDKPEPKTIGAGKTLLLTGEPGDYRRERFAGGGAARRAAVRDFLAANGAAMPFTVSADPFVPATVVAYRDGASRYVGVQRDYKVADQAAADLTIRGPAPAHVYDCRAGKYLGHAAEITVSLPVARGHLYAFLPYQATDLAVSGLPETAAPGARLIVGAALRADGAVPDGSVLRVDVLGPDGTPILALCRNVPTRGGVAEFPLHLAANDPVGTWTVRCRDLATGVAVDRPLEVVK